ncbi:J domain-containing protein [Bacillus sp. SORGH_AS_0510]|uniref:J domain-containing protein n=1 Tax=Bacillus sp. SORGH_AS_0510 TaxID=3041771 RepID=UPI0027D9081E|nr:J domain-containing protein [Bacillus sp. SORGH_AS_0510]
MLNVKEAAEHLTSAGIAASEDMVMNWIEEGKLKAEVAQRRKTTYKISVKDLTEFIIQKHVAQLISQNEQSHRENRYLTEQLELLKTRVHIEQSKVRTLKKLLNSQIEGTEPSTFPYDELLGLKKQNSNNSQTLKKEFKKLLKALHPDRGGDERLFKVFHEHYENLK